MVIDLSQVGKDPAFRINHVRIADEDCYLVCLHDPSSVVWTEENIIFRSSVWNSEGELISASFPKFFNWDENPDLFPSPKRIEDLDAVIEKVDGSTLIVSKYKGHLIVRTRGTTDASILDKNGYEVEILKKKYPNAFDFGDVETSDHSRIFEWVSPNNRIVVPYAECDISLIASIKHTNYSFFSQSELDSMAEQYGVKRPKRFVFSSLIHMRNEVKNFIGMEGVCCYYDGGQHIRKLKGEDYLIRHRAKEKFQTFNSLVDFFVLENMPHYEAFLEMIEREADNEVATQCQTDARDIIDVMSEITDTLLNVALFVEMVKVDTESDKEAAEIISSRYQDQTLTGLAFAKYRGKGISERTFLNIIKRARKNVTNQPASFD